MQNPQPFEKLRRLLDQRGRHRNTEEAITVTYRTELQRLKQQMRQRIRAQVNARRLAVATALAEAETPSADEPTP